MILLGARQCLVEQRQPDDAVVAASVEQAMIGAGAEPDGPFSERQVGLPPLNLNLARMMIESTRACRAQGSLNRGPW